MFYGVDEGEKANLSAALETISRIYRGRVFAADMLISICRNLTFAGDPRFLQSFKSSARNAQEDSLLWRLHVLTWAARQAMQVEGDFVECGVLRGFSSSVVCKYLDFANVPRTFYLYDSFSDMPPETSSEHERHTSNPSYASDPAEWLNFVKQVFAAFPNVKVIKGIVPFIFETTVPEKIAFLHIDMNAAKAELMALECLYDRISPGGVLILDDFGMVTYGAQTMVELQFMRQRGVQILELPTGQGVVFKPLFPTAVALDEAVRR